MTKKLDFKIRYSTKDGELGVTINGIKYIYYLDAGFIPEIMKKYKHTPGKTLAFLKKVADTYKKESRAITFLRSTWGL